MLTLYGNKDNAKPYLNRAQSQLRGLLGHASLQTILDLVAETADTEAEQRILHEMAASGLRVVWQGVRVVSHNPLDLARASLQLNYGMRRKLGEILMPNGNLSKLSARIHAALYDMDAHLTPATEPAFVLRLQNFQSMHGLRSLQRPFPIWMIPRQEPSGRRLCERSVS
jgi:hypothetical protein